MACVSGGSRFRLGEERLEGQRQYVMWDCQKAMWLGRGVRALSEIAQGQVMLKQVGRRKTYPEATEELFEETDL